MPTVLIVESNTPDLIARGKSGAAGFLATFAALAPSLSTRIVAPYAGPVAPDALDGVAGVVLTGSGVDWATDAAEAAPLRAYADTVFASGLPVWGSCNGLQLAAVVLGGAVAASPNGREEGLAQNIEITAEGQGHPMLAGRAQGYAVPCVHRDEVSRLPSGMVRLAGNAHSPVQAAAMKSGGITFWGTQYHPELTLAEVAGYLATAGRAAPDTDMAEPDLADRAVELRNWLALIGALPATT